MRTAHEFRTKLSVNFGLLKGFIASLIIVQAMTAVSPLNFDSVLPWILLVLLMPFWMNVQKWEKQRILWAVAGALLFTVLYGLSLTGEKGVSFYAPLSAAGGFLAGSMVPDGYGRWKKETNRKDRIAALPMAALIGLALKMEGFLSLQDLNDIPGNLILFAFLYAEIIGIFSVMRKREWWFVGGAVLFGLFSSVGHFSIFENYGWAGLLLSFLCWFILFYIVIEKCDQIAGMSGVFSERKINKPWAYGVFFFFLTLFVDLFFLLTFFPGVMEYDSYQQMCQVLGDPYSNHHPWLHTMMIKGIYKAGLFLLHSTNRAFALYSLFSICMLAFTYACVVTWFCAKGMKKQYVILLGLLYLLSPINQMYSIIMWKDIPFGVSVVLFTILICRMRENLMEGRSNRRCWIIFVPLGFCVCFFRSNGLYVFLGMIPFLIWGFWKQKKAVVLSIALVLGMGILYKGPIFHSFNVKEPDTIESLSIPAQQMAAVIAYEGTITEGQSDILSKVIDLQKVPEAYLGSVTCSDAIKDLVREKNHQEYIQTHAGEFLKVYLDLFWQNKAIYVKAFVDETKGYWYHKTHFPFIWATYIQENGMGIDRDSKVPSYVEQSVREYLERYKAHFDQYLSTGLYVYLFFLSLIVALKRKSKYLLAYLPALGIWGTLLIATPVFADLRYAYAIYLSVPLLICITLFSGQKEERGIKSSA